MGFTMLLQSFNYKHIYRKNSVIFSDKKNTNKGNFVFNSMKLFKFDGIY